MNIYLISTASVKWNNEESRSFPLLNGVKQGAIISAPLFALYINPLLVNLQNCKINSVVAVLMTLGRNRPNRPSQNLNCDESWGVKDRPPTKTLAVLDI